jgi:hypothetical protein
MDWKMFILLLIIIAIFLATFMYPKYCGNSGNDTVNVFKDCECIGSKMTGDSGVVHCLGIPVGQSCYKLLPDGERTLVGCPEI